MIARSATSRTSAPLPPSPLSNSIRSPPRPRSGSRPTLTRRPDLACRRQLAPQRAHIFGILAPVQLDRVQVEQRRGVGDRRRAARRGTRRRAACPSLRASTGQRRRFVGRDVAGAARHEHEAGERRWPGGAHVGAAIQSAQLDAAEDELARSLRRIGSAHQRRADQEAVDQRRQAARRRRASRCRIRRRAARSGAKRREPLGRRQGRCDRSRRSRLLMPISGAPSASARRISASSWTSTSASMPKRRASAIISRARRRRRAATASPGPRRRRRSAPRRPGAGR